MAPKLLAAPFRCPAELCNILIGVAFSCADMPNCLAIDLPSTRLYTLRILATVINDMACAWTPNIIFSSAMIGAVVSLDSKISNC